MNYKDQAIDFFKNDTFAMDTTGIIIEEVEKGYAKCSLPIDQRHLNANDFVMGGAIFTLADFTMAVASNAGNPCTVSLNLNINYVRPAKGPVLYAEAKCVKDGKSVCFYEVAVKNSKNETVAILSGNGFRKA